MSRGSGARARTAWRLATLLVVLVGWLLSAARVAVAQPAPPVVPPELRPWVPWVLADAGDDACVTVGTGVVCQWPGALDLDLGAQSGTFELRVVADKRVDVVLPGSAEAWPLDVQIDGKPAVVLESGAVPAASVARGAHQIRGRFAWRTLPDALEIPADVALVRLKLRGKAVAFPRREGTRLPLPAPEEAPKPEPGGAEKQPAAPAEPDRLEVEVFRRVADGAPFLVTTHLALKISGRSREIDLGNVLVEGSTPLGLDSPLPARLDAAGRLVVAARPGEHAVVVTAGSLKAPAELAVPAHAVPWPDQEIWVWAPDTALRQVDVAGLPGIDANRTNLPTAWRELRALQAAPGGRLTLTTGRRGQPEPPPNSLRLVRDFYLDQDGGGYSVKDKLTGDMHRGWRLDLAEGELGHVEVARRGQVITLRDGKRGVELRERNVDISADSRLGPSRTLPAVGWSEDVQLEARVHLPSGWDLLFASGADTVPETWLTDWTVLSAVWVLGIALVIGRLLGARAGALALAALVLGHDQLHEIEVGYWIPTLFIVWLLGKARAGWQRNVVRAFWAVAFTVLAVRIGSFSYHQIQMAIAPQMIEDVMQEEREVEQVFEQADNKEGGTGTRAKGDEGSMGAQMRGGKSYSYGVVAAAPQALEKAKAPATKQEAQDIVQTGVGMPDWDGRTYHFSWSGPVQHGHHIALFALPPMASSALALVRVLTMLALLYLLVRRNPPPAPATPAPAPPAAMVAAALLALFAVTSWSSRAAAQPSKELLDDLKARLLQKADCGEACVSVSRFDLSIERQDLRILAEVHVGAPAVWKLPGPAQSFVPASVDVDGKPATALALFSDGFLYLRLDPGRHSVTLKGPIEGDELTLALGQNPHVAVARAKGWAVDGISEAGRIDGTLRLTRAAVGDEQTPEATSAAPAAAATNLPVWYEVTRSLEIGPTWSVVTTVKNVARATPSAVTVRVPLLPGERVTTPGTVVDGATAVVAGGATFKSTLPPGAVLELVAPEGRPITSVWNVYCDPLWRCSADGIAPVKHEDQGKRFLSYRPWPGEKVALRFEKPESAPGPSTTLDAATLELEPDLRVLRATLRLTVRTSSGVTQTIGLPARSELREATVNGEAQSARLENGTLKLSLAPGIHQVMLSWQEASPLGVLLRTPEVHLGGDVVNAHVTIRMPSERWAFFAGGSRWGAVVFLWLKLGLLAAIAGLVMQRLPWRPLAPRDWVLLSLGFVVVNAFPVVVVAVWFCALAWRESIRFSSRVWHIVAQIALAVLTLVAAICLFATLARALGSSPDPLVAGQNSSNYMLRWYAERVRDVLPRPWVVVLPEWTWRVLFGAWAAWLGWNLVRRWSRWAFTSFGSGGFWPARMVPAVAGAPEAAIVAAPAPPAADAAPSAEPSASSEPEPPVGPASKK